MTTAVIGDEPGDAARRDGGRAVRVGTHEWFAELMRTGQIAQDDDTTVDREQAERDCLRYVELVEMVQGNEGRDVFDALLASMQVAEDYEVYQTPMRVLHRFPDELIGEGLYGGWSGLLQRSPDTAWDLLNQLARGRFGIGALESFKRAWGRDQSNTGVLLALVNEQETDGWLSSLQATGQLRPPGVA